MRIIWMRISIEREYSGHIARMRVQAVLKSPR